MAKTPNSKSFVTAGKQNEDTKFLSELQRVKEYLTKNIATATMVSFALGIYRPNLSRHKRTLEKHGQLWVFKKGICKSTGFQADYLTCDPELLKGGIHEK